MSDQVPRVIKATKFRGEVSMGPVDIHAYTKHGTTSMISVMPPEKLETGVILKTQNWILGAKQFVVLGVHNKPMKLPGEWYEVRIVKS